MEKMSITNYSIKILMLAKIIKSLKMPWNYIKH